MAAYFAISDVLDAAGFGEPNQAGALVSYTLDRYLDSYGQLDLVISQKLWRGFSIGFSAKNLTDTKRREPRYAAQRAFADRRAVALSA